MGLNCIGSSMKYTLFIFNLIFAIGGIALVAIVGILLEKNGDVDIFEKSDDPGINSTKIVVFGALVIAVAFFGCIGSFRESECQLKLYALCLLIVVVFQVLLANSVSDSSSLIANMSIAMAVFELIAVVLSVCLSFNIRESSRFS